MIKVAVDAMGGDYAPVEMVKGAVDAVTKTENLEVVLVGQEDQVQRELEKYSYPKDRISIVHASEVIETEEPPVNAIRRKKDSSLVVAMNLVKKQEADALVSAGSSGAILVGGQVIVGRIKGVRRGALAPVVPSRFGGALLIDCGANVECTAEYLLQFALMGSAYMECAQGRKNPKVALLNNGTEEKKGTEMYREAHQLLKAASAEGKINFVGNIEGREIFSGKADVLVCDGFTGNMVLKTIEGTAKFFSAEIKNMFMASAITKIAGLIVKPKINELRSMMDYKEVGGSPIMGIKKPVFKAHGSSDAKAFHSAICRAMKFAEGGAIESIENKINTIKGE